MSVIIPTYNRHEKVKSTVGKWLSQSFSPEDYEIIVVDDGSNPPVSFSERLTRSPELSVIRLEGDKGGLGFRSSAPCVARNTVTKSAKGELLIFVDDDILVEETFLNSHWKAHKDFPDAIKVGAIRLPIKIQQTPFGSFRQKLDIKSVPKEYGLVKRGKYVCAGGNMTIKKSNFLNLKGFDERIPLAEDLDFSLRYTASRGRIVFVPEALGIHQDSNATDIRSFCRRSERGIILMIPFCKRYSNLSSNIERERINGKTIWGKEPLSQSIRKTAKEILSIQIIIELLFRFADLMEKIAPPGKILDKTYRILLGLHIFRGYRVGINEAREQ